MIVGASVVEVAATRRSSYSYLINCDFHSQIPSYSYLSSSNAHTTADLCQCLPPLIENVLTADLCQCLPPWIENGLLSTWEELWGIADFSVLSQQDVELLYISNHILGDCSGGFGVPRSGVKLSFIPHSICL